MFSTTSSPSTPTKRRRGRPRVKSYKSKGETTMEISITNNLDASHNSAAALRQGVNATPVLKYGHHKSPRGGKDTNGSPDSAGSPSSAALQALQASPTPASRRNTTSSSASNPFLTPARTMKALSSSPLFGSERSSPVKMSPLRTSPLSLHELSKRIQKTTCVSLPQIDRMLLMPSSPSPSTGSQPAVNPSFLESSPLLPLPTSGLHLRANENALMPGGGGTSSPSSYPNPPSTPKTNFSSILSSSPMYMHWYSHTPAQTTLTATPGGVTLKLQSVSTAAVPCKRTASSEDYDEVDKVIALAPPPPAKRTKFLPADYMVSLRIGPDGKASVVTERRKPKPRKQHSLPSLDSISSPGRPLNMFVTSPFATGKSPVLNNYIYKEQTDGDTAGTGGAGGALRIGVDPFVNGISSNEFESVPPPQTPSESPFNATPQAFFARDASTAIRHDEAGELESLEPLDEPLEPSAAGPLLTTGSARAGLRDGFDNPKYDARYALQALLDETYS